MFENSSLNSQVFKDEFVWNLKRDARGLRGREGGKENIIKGRNGGKMALYMRIIDKR